MELRILIAYLLIGLLAAMALLFARHVVVKRRNHRRAMRGHGRHNRMAGRSAPKVEVP